MTAIGDPVTVALVFLIIFAGGTVKGALGIGLPAVSMSLLPMLIDPALAVTLLSVPILVTNAQQVVTEPGWPAVARRFRVGAIALLVTIFAVSLMLDVAPSPLVNIVVGIALTMFAVSGLLKIRLPVTEGPHWQVLAGVLAGITGGLSSVKTPVIIYCAALEMPRRDFMVAAGFLFFVGGVGLLAGLSTTGLLTSETLTLSCLALIFAMIGFQVGAWVGRRINAALFRRMLLSAMLLLGLRMILVNLV